jgi:thiol-disulfide isomerase/thioredoxin
MKLRILVVLMTLGVFALTTAVMLSRVEAKTTTPQPVNFTLTDTNGKKLSLATYRGKVIVVDLWATWCHFCVEEIPDLMAIQKAAKDKKKPLQFFGVAMQDDPAKVKAFVKAYKVNYPIVFGTDAAMKPFGPVEGYPKKFIINKKGVIVETIVGARPRADLEKVINKYLK